MSKPLVWTDQAKADVHSIEQDRYVLSGEGATKQLKGVTPPLIRLRAENHLVFFRDHGDHLKIERVLDRKEACLLMAPPGALLREREWDYFQFVGRAISRPRRLLASRRLRSA